MKKKVNKNLLGPVNYNALRLLILERQLEEDVIIKIHSQAYDNLVLEYRDTYDTPMSNDFKILGIVKVLLIDSNGFFSSSIISSFCQYIATGYQPTSWD